MDETHTTDERFTAAFWDGRYATHAHVWSGNPNPWLVRAVTGLPPGRALDAGCGEGADAHWLAGRGWRVHAVDVSTVALERGAAEAGPAIADRIEWEQADLLAWVPVEQAYDLVSTQFLHFPSAVRTPVFAGLAAAVAPGGSLLVVGHHPSDLDGPVPRPHEPDLFFTAEQVAGGLDPQLWTVRTAAAEPRETTDGEGRTVTVHDAVLHAVRR